MPHRRARRAALVKCSTVVRSRECLSAAVPAIRGTRHPCAGTAVFCGARMKTPSPKIELGFPASLETACGQPSRVSSGCRDTATARPGRSRFTSMHSVSGAALKRLPPIPLLLRRVFRGDPRPTNRPRFSGPPRSWRDSCFPWPALFREPR